MEEAPIYEKILNPSVYWKETPGKGKCIEKWLSLWKPFCQGRLRKRTLIQQMESTRLCLYVFSYPDSIF